MYGSGTDQVCTNKEVNEFNSDSCVTAIKDIIYVFRSYLHNKIYEVVCIFIEGETILE
jgi:hypothetical protein